MPFDNVLLVMPSGRLGLGYAFDFIPTGLEYLAVSPLYKKTYAEFLK